MFSLNMRYLSPRGYDYLRKKFDDHLPHPATIRKWFSFSHAGANRGFMDASLHTLKKLVDETDGTIYVSIAFDEMSIRCLVQWLDHKKKFSGFINYGTREFEGDPLPIATNALVVMLNGINVRVTIPVAYYYITTLIAEEKAIMIASILKTLTDIGIRVMSVTSDGLITNFAAYDILGASFDPEGIVPYFINSSDGNKVYVFHDPPHMLKLIRNCLGDQKVLCDRNKRPIEWKFIERLYRSTQSTLCSHKLTKRHIDWKSTPMKVGLATQTMSLSVAQSIEKLNRSGVRQFEDSEGTVEFITRINNLFDIFNSDEDVVNNVHKTPINSESKRQVFEFMNDMMAYIDGLTVSGAPITGSKRYTGFVGFKSNIIAVKMIYEELVETKQITKLRTVGIQQDYLESFFGRMRSGNGNNTNPSQEQFDANLQKILLNRELTCSALSNCIDKLDILTVPSTQINRQPIEPEFIMVANERGENEVDEEKEEREEREESEEILSGELTITMGERFGVANAAGCIEATIERSKKFDCGDCSTIFERNEKIDHNLFVKQKKNVLACKSTMDICEISNTEFSKYLNSVHESCFDYYHLFNEIKSKISLENLFIETNFEHDPSHKIFFVDFIVEQFVKIRAIQRARKITSDQHRTLVRSAKMHDIHFAGQ